MEDLIKRAKEVAKKRKIGDLITGAVGSALVSEKGNIYVGKSVEACCGIGFCGERTAIVGMITNGEYRIKKIVAVSSRGKILPPCGVCREFIYEIDRKNMETEIAISKNKTVKLKDLLPHTWQEKW